MTRRLKARHPAIKHAGYSATGILPGENAADFAKLHQELTSELSPTGALEADIVANIARLAWRRRNLATFRMAQLARQRVAKIRQALVPETDFGVPPSSDETVQSEATVVEKTREAEAQARNELGELYALAEMSNEATLDQLIKNLEVQERLDAMIDKSLKRLLFIRGLKSLAPGAASKPALPGPSRND